jgi:type II secretion system protein L
VDGLGAGYLENNALQEMSTDANVIAELRTLAAQAIPAQWRSQAKKINVFATALEALLSSPAVESSAINLLQSEFAPVEVGQAKKRAWRTAAALAAAAIVTAGALQAAALWRVRHLEAQLNQQMEAVFHEALGPNAVLRVEPFKQLKSEYQKLGAGRSEAAELVALLHRIAPLLQTEIRMSLTSIDYRDNHIELGLKANSVATVDGFRERIMSIGGLRAEISNTSMSDGLVSARLRITVLAS